MTITSPLPYPVPLVLLPSQIRAVIAPSFLVLPPNVLHPQRLHPHPLLIVPLPHHTLLAITLITYLVLTVVHTNMHMVSKPLVLYITLHLLTLLMSHRLRLCLPGCSIAPMLRRGMAWARASSKIQWAVRSLIYAIAAPIVPAPLASFIVGPRLIHLPPSIHAIILAPASHVPIVDCSIPTSLRRLLL